MSLTDILPLAIDLPEKDRAVLLREIADSMGMELIDLEVDQRRSEMETDSASRMTEAELKAEIERLRNAE